MIEGQRPSLKKSRAAVLYYCFEGFLVYQRLGFVVDQLHFVRVCVLVLVLVLDVGIVVGP